MRDKIVYMRQCVVFILKSFPHSRARMRVANHIDYLPTLL